MYFLIIRFFCFEKFFLNIIRRKFLKMCFIIKKRLDFLLILCYTSARKISSQKVHLLRAIFLKRMTKKRKGVVDFYLVIVRHSEIIKNKIV